MTKKQRELFIGALFAAVATLGTLVLGEVAIRVISSHRLIYNIEMVKYARELKVLDPRGLVSHVHRPSSEAQLMGVKIALNSLGDRGPEIAEPKPAGTKRLLVFGSSITMGWGVPFESVFTSVLAQKVNATQALGPGAALEVVNAGIGNYNTVFQHQLFLEQYPRVRPDMVVLHYFISDVQPRGMGRDNALLKHSALAAFCFDRFGQVQFRQQKTDLFTFYRDLYADDSAAWRQTRDLIAAMRDRCRADGVPFLVMIVPDIHDLSPGTPFAPLYAKIDTAFRQLDLPVLNAFAPFQQRFGADVTKLWIQSDDPHPNAAGHALMAELLEAYLVREKPLAFSPRL